MKGLLSQQTGQLSLCCWHYGYCSHPESIGFPGSKQQHSTMVQAVDVSPYPGKGRPASGELQQMVTAESERQSLYAPTAEAPPTAEALPTAWAQSRTPRDLNRDLNRGHKDKLYWRQ